MMQHYTSEALWLPLFPLNTVLFPDGVLPIKVFETRYIDMVKECIKDERPFGVVLIKSGAEVGGVAEPETVGCLAHIARWDMETLGVLMLRTQGGTRFRILETRVLEDSRLEARVAHIPPDTPIPADEIHLACAKALKTLVENINAKGIAEHGRSFVSPFSRPVKLGDASWVGNRWSEILPISLQARQKLMELEDTAGRLAIIHHYLKQHKII